jgi:GTP cyclohydrolase III
MSFAPFSIGSAETCCKRRSGETLLEAEEDEDEEEEEEDEDEDEDEDEEDRRMSRFDINMATTA